MKKTPFPLNPFAYVPGLHEVTTLQHSAASCTRCNACVQSCPSYFSRQEELFSPRGRTQLLRLILEKKIQPAAHRALLQDTVRTCLLCARCTEACAGAVPVAVQMTALRRAANITRWPLGLRLLLHLRGTRPRLFEVLLQTALFLRRLGCVSVLIPALPRWMKHAHAVLPRRTQSLRRALKAHALPTEPAQASCIYLPSPEAAHVDGAAGLLSVQWLNQQPRIWLGRPSGLFEYLHGRLSTCLRQAKKLLTDWEKAATATPLPLVTDSLEIYSFLKNYPVLFAFLPGWKRRAQRLAEHVFFITDFPFSDGNTTPRPGRAALEDSSALYPPGDVAVRAREILQTHFGKNLLQCRYSRFPVPAAGLSLGQGTQAEQTVLGHVKDVAREQLTDVYCLSGWAALELNAALRRYYPAAQAKHIVYLRAGYERISDGKLQAVR